MRTLLRFTLLPLLLLFIAISSASHARPSGEIRSSKVLGGWNPIKDINDPHVREIAEFAVAEHNKQQQANAGATRLTLTKVVRGATQVVAGTKYRLVVAAADGSGAAAQYEAVVWEKPWQKFMQLMSFNLAKS